jgi:uncharacterized protein YkwD
MFTSRRAFLSLLLGGCWLPAPLSAAWSRTPRAGTDEEERLLEKYLQELTDKQRVSDALRSLAWLEPLAQVARAHSADMLARDFFGHRNPDGAGPGERLARHGLTLSAFAENVYELINGPADPKEAAASVFRGWMQNSGHRHNILDGRFRYIGIGAISRDDRLAVTQLFGA